MDKMIRQYKILREIGKGGMGVIYKALDPKTQRHVAVKVLPKSMVDQPTVERFNREGRVMAKLKHPNLIDVLDFGMEQGEHYFVMEFVDGDNVRNILKHEGAFSVDRSIDIVIKVADALAYIHAEGMIHRDVKPGNIMLTEGGKVKLMDLGLVKVLGVTQLTVEGTSIGTAEYMSPEQISGEGVDSRTDIYSLGVALYEMLTGHPPFTADNLQALLKKQKYDAPPSLRLGRPEISQWLELITFKAMAKELPQRYQKVQDLVDELMQFRGKQKAVQDSEHIFKEKEFVTQKIPAGESPPWAQETLAMDSPAVRPDAAIEKTAVSPPLKAERAEPSHQQTRGRFPFSLPVKCALILCVGFGSYYYRVSLRSFASHVIGRGTGRGALVDETEGYLTRLEKADTFYNSGLKYFSQGEFDKAISELKEAISIRSNYGPYYRELAMAFEKKKQRNNAIKAWNNLLKYDQKSPYAEQAREQLRILQTQ